MANGSGMPGIQSRWEAGDLVFFVKSTGAEVLRLSVDGTVSFGGVAFPAADGTAGQVLTTDGAGVATWETPA